MKTNLNSIFATSTADEANGIWFSINDVTKFRLRRFGGANSHKMKVAYAKHHKPKARLMELGQLSAEETQTILIKVFVDACVVEWEGVEVDGKEFEFNFDNAVKLFEGLPELFQTLWKYSESFESFKEDVGNS